MKDKNKVTLYIPSELHKKLKIKAADVGSMSALVEKAINFYTQFPEKLDNDEIELDSDLETLNLDLSNINSRLSNLLLKLKSSDSYNAAAISKEIADLSRQRSTLIKKKRNLEKCSKEGLGVGKLETETANVSVSVPVEKERIVIERNTTTDGTVAAPDEVAIVEVYEETADINRQAFVREEVSVRKEVEQEIVQESETTRREEWEL